METPDFLVQEESPYEVVNGVFGEAGSSADLSPYEVPHVILGNTLYDSGRPPPLYIKVEQVEQGEEVEQIRCEVEPSTDATDDENVAVEALRQLGGSRPKIEGYFCPHCNISSSTQQELEDHIDVCNKAPINVTHICQFCNEAFDRKHDLNNHLVCHAVSRPHACRICGSLFIQKQDLLDHMPSHGHSHANTCKHCGKQFTRGSALTNHLKIHNYQPGRALIDRISDTNELEHILTGSSDPELQSVDKSQKISLPSITQITIGTGSTSMASVANTWALNYESDNYNGMNLSDINPNLGEKLDEVDDKSMYIPVERSHQPEEKDLRPYACEKCNKRFNREKALINHMNQHQHLFSCERCDQNFGNPTTLEKHLLYCGIKQTLKFVKPGSIHETATQILTVSKRHDRGLKRPTDDDGFDINAYNKLYNKHVCDQCNKGFTTKQKLFRHAWIHRKKTYFCEYCSIRFETEKELDVHRLAMHKSGSPYDCTECGKNFCSRQGLWEHSRIHTKDTNYLRCEECNKNFSSRQGFLIHKRKHSNERPYGCRFCTKSFRDGGSLRKHERIHTGERPYACPICNKSFNQKVVLREHVRSLHAANARPDKTGLYPCVLCDIVCNDKDDLSMHFVKHSDELVLLAKDASRNNIAGKLQSTTSMQTQEEVKCVPHTVVSCEMAIDDDLSRGEVGEPTQFLVVKGEDTDIQNASKLKMECVISEESDQDNGVECDLCGVLFKSKEDLSYHIPVHI